MKKLLFTLLTISTFSLMASNARYRVMFRTDPSTSAVIGWDQTGGSYPVVHYDVVDHGTNANAYAYTKSVDRSVSYKGMNNHFARLTNLQPNTAYYFLIKDSQGNSQRFWFKTTPNSSSERLSFIAGGDSRNNANPRRNANKLVAKLRPHAVFFGGDMTNGDSNSEWIEWMNDWQLTTGNDGRMIPIVAARGNHEGSNNSIYHLFDVPSSNVYYAITFGGNLIRSYTLNTEISISGSQTTWLNNDLASNSNITWKMAQYHKPMRPHVSSKSEGNSQYSNWATPFKNNGVRLVVECDAHTVKTTWPVVPSTGGGSDEGFIRDDANGTVYVGEGCWGAPLRNNDDNKDWTRASGKFNQFKWIFVDQEKIEIRTIKVDNADQVGQVNDNNIFAAPSNLDIWSPSSGSVVTIQKNNNGGGSGSGNTFEKRIASSMDDVEQNQNGSIYTNSSDIELVADGSRGNQTIGLRFTGVNIPQGATITNAYIQFTCDETNTGTTNLTIKGEDVNNSSAFTTSTNNVSNRTKTSASANWSPSSWNSVGASGSNERTPELKNIVQEIVNRSGWSANNAMSFIITGTGERTAESYDGSSGSAPLLHIEYSDGSSSTEEGTLNKRVATGNDDAEEATNGNMYLTSSDLELVYDSYQSAGNQQVGIRFTNLGIPQGATITNAYIEFTTDESTTGGCNVSIYGHDVNNAGQFTSTNGNISGRTKTSASVSWSPSGWSSVGSKHQTPDIKAVVQEIVNRSGWNSGNSMAFIITGSGKRTAESYNGSSSNAPLLHVEYSYTSAKQGVNIDFSSIENGIKVYPNPASDVINIENNNEEEVSVLIKALNTAHSLQDKVEGHSIKQINISGLPAGVYVAIISNGEESSTYKFIKQ